ncbi:GxxExxY protein [Geobacter sp. FeAm09]|uniref:GxxExxY protein n=1 Tax=Geobacter sp. FeAm09 TaxID=2597769 RepID=UPI001F0F23E1|nr:GxxExxY protein [Geobacter sp. FeAm09]
MEGIYEKALCHELHSSGLSFQSQAVIPIVYKGTSLGDHRLDLLVEDEIIVELKAVERIESVFKAQLLSYLKLTEKSWVCS